MRSNTGAILFGTIVVCLLGTGVALGHGKTPGHTEKHMKPQEVKIAVTEAGFVPKSVSVKRGVPIVLVITRETDQTCATQAVFPSIDKPVDLPLNKAVRVALPAASAGRLSYACGMGMLHGELVVR